MEYDIIAFVARQIAVDIFQIGDEPNSLTHRIQFMGGDLNNEKPQGGLDDKALTNLIEDSLRRHLSSCIAKQYPKCTNNPI